MKFKRERARGRIRLGLGLGRFGDKTRRPAPSNCLSPVQSPSGHVDARMDDPTSPRISISLPPAYTTGAPPTRATLEQYLAHLASLLQSPLARALVQPENHPNRLTTLGDEKLPEASKEVWDWSAGVQKQEREKVLRELAGGTLLEVPGCQVSYHPISFWIFEQLISRFVAYSFLKPSGPSSTSSTDFDYLVKHTDHLLVMAAVPQSSGPTTSASSLPRKFTRSRDYQR